MQVDLILIRIRMLTGTGTGTGIDIELHKWWHAQWTRGVVIHATIQAYQAVRMSARGNHRFPKSPAAHHAVKVAGID